MHNSFRRQVLRVGLLSCASMLSGCWLDPRFNAESTGGEQSAAAPPPAGSAPPAQTSAPAPAPVPAEPAAWVVNPYPTFVVGSGATFDLADTLPVGVARGGVFGISSSGEQLPVGMALTSAGILSVGSATVGNVNGVVFTYAGP